MLERIYQGPIRAVSAARQAEANFFTPKTEDLSLTPDPVAYFRSHNVGIMLLPLQEGEEIVVGGRNFSSVLSAEGSTRGFIEIPEFTDPYNTRVNQLASCFAGLLDFFNMIRMKKEIDAHIGTEYQSVKVLHGRVNKTVAELVGRIGFTVEEKGGKYNIAGYTEQIENGIAVFGQEQVTPRQTLILTDQAEAAHPELWSNPHFSTPILMGTEMIPPQGQLTLEMRQLAMRISQRFTKVAAGSVLAQPLLYAVGDRSDMVAAGAFSIIAGGMARRFYKRGKGQKL